LFHQWVEFAYGTPIDENELTKEEREQAIRRELEGWDDFGVAQWVNEEAGRILIKQGKLQLVEYRWVFSFQENEDSSRRVKARLCLKGFQDVRNVSGEAPTIDKSVCVSSGIVPRQFQESLF